MRLRLRCHGGSVHSSRTNANHNRNRIQWLRVYLFSGTYLCLKMVDHLNINAASYYAVSHCIRLRGAAHATTCHGDARGNLLQVSLMAMDVVLLCWLFSALRRAEKRLDDKECETPNPEVRKQPQPQPQPWPWL